MAVERLYIENTYIPLTQGLNPSITKSIVDLEQPEKRKATFSKSVTIPRSKEADKVFSQIFEINISNKTFNVTAKADCLYTVDDETVIDGYLQLKEIKVTDFNDIFYEVVMYSDTADFWAAIKDLYLTDLDLSTYDHPFTKEIQQLSWATSTYVGGGLVAYTLGTGYVYALIDYGYSSDATNFIYTQVPCSVFAREYIRRIISEAGFTYTSAFIDSTICKSLIVPSSPNTYVLNSTEIADRQFVANTPVFTSTGTTTTGNLSINALGANDLIRCTAETSDAGGNYNPATGIFTAVSTGYYDFNALCDLTATFTPATGNAVKTRCEVDGYILMTYEPSGGGAETQLNAAAFYITYDDSGGFIIGARTTQAAPTYPETDYLNAKHWSDFPNDASLTGRAFAVPNRYQLVVNNVFLAAGDKIRLYYKAGVFRKSSMFGYTTDFFVDGGGTYYSGNATLTCSVAAFYNKVVNTTLAEGNTLTMEKVIPKNIKQVDFLTSIFKMFNLWLDIDPLDSNNLIIETRDSYLGTDELNVHELIDRSKEIIYLPMGALDAKRFNYNYKEDKDYWNTYYKNQYGEIYGNRFIESTGEFFTQNKETNVIFSSTTLVGLPNQDRVLPTIYQLNDLNYPIQTESNIRILYYGGLKTCSQGWNHINYIQGWPYLPLTATYTTYPYAGHFDDPFNPTLDINFGLVKEVYYDDNIQDITVTDNNLVNKYHSKQLREITDENSYIVRAWVHLTPSMYKQFTFDKVYFFDSAYFRLNKIDGYNPTSEETTLCEFLKLNDATVFTAGAFPVDGNPAELDPNMGGGGGVIFTEDVPVKGTKTAQQPDGNNIVPKSAQVSGEGNVVWSGAKNVQITGNENIVESGAENIVIDGSGNTITAGVKNVTLINTNDVTVTESGVTYIDGKIQGYWVEKTAAFLVDETVYGYYLNGSGATVQARLNSSEGEFFFKCTDGTNRVYVDAAPFTIDNTSATFDLLENESLRVKWNGDDQTYYIIN